MKRRQVLAVLLMGMMIFHMAGCKGKSMAAQAGDEAAAQAEVEKFPLQIGRASCRERVYVSV